MDHGRRRYPRAYAHLIWTSDDFRELVLALILALDHRLEDRWVVRSQVCEDMRYAGLFLSVWVDSTIEFTNA